jgi:hypothetical protein
MIDALIDKTDVFEQVRDGLAAILAAESASQQALASAAGKDPALWKLRVYSERSNPWEAWLNGAEDPSPIVNIWLDNAQIDAAASNQIERQQVDATFNIDIYGYGESAETVAGHTPGDEAAAKEAHRAARLVRNILMSDQYVFLNAQGTVSRRWLHSISAFQPQQSAESVQKIVGCRLAFRVVFNEFSPQNTPETLQFVSVDIVQADDGEIMLAEADYDYSPLEED